jgi:hypothetical protein
LLEVLTRMPLEQQRIALVERKDKGHPDSICDPLAEAVSLALCREYQATFGRILHHNTDKGLLVAGRTLPRLERGQVLEPMRRSAKVIPRPAKRPGTWRRVLIFVDGRRPFLVDVRTNRRSSSRASR